MENRPTPIGTHDAFRDVASWDDDTARTWVEALDLRASSPDQTRLRRRLVELAGLRLGDTAVEVGCGTGALLCDLARAVGAGGRVVGVEPQPAFVEAAEGRLSREGISSVAEVRNESAARLGLADESSAAALAQTVLIHLPDEVLRAALAEMVRVVRRGGRVVSADQDGDTWVIDHPDRELTRRVVRFNSDQRYADGWTGRRLRRLFHAGGLRDVEVHVFVHADTGAASYLYGMAERLGAAAAEAGAITHDERLRWLAALRELAARGDFFSSINYYVCVGRRD